MLTLKDLFQIDFQDGSLVDRLKVTYGSVASAWRGKAGGVYSAFELGNGEMIVIVKGERTSFKALPTLGKVLILPSRRVGLKKEEVLSTILSIGNYERGLVSLLVSWRYLSCCLFL